MASSIADFRRHLYQTVTLLSGLTVEIKRLTAWDFVGLGDLPIPSASTLDGQQIASISPEHAVQLQRYTDRAVARGVVAPKMTDARDDGGEPVCSPDVLHVSELLPDDYQVLSLAILQWAGLLPEAAKAVESFRADPVRPDDSSPGGEVQRLAVAYFAQ